MGSAALQAESALGAAPGDDAESLPLQQPCLLCPPPQRLVSFPVLSAGAQASRCDYPPFCPLPSRAYAGCLAGGTLSR